MPLPPTTEDGPISARAHRRGLTAHAVVDGDDVTQARRSMILVGPIRVKETPDVDDPE